MSRSRWLIAFIVLLVPILARMLWFYQGIYQPAGVIATPEYASFELPKAVLSTPGPETEKINLEKPNTGDGVVLVDIAHDNLFTATELQPLFDSIAKAGGVIIFGDSEKNLAKVLKSVDAYLVIAPSSPYLAGETAAITRFMERGGKLLVIADPTRDMSQYGYLSGETAATLQSVSIVNTLLEPFGITFVEDYLYDQAENEANFRNIILSELDKKDPLTNNLKKVVFYGAHSLKTNQKILIRAQKTTYSSLTDAGGEFAVAASANNGRVVALGDFTFITNPYYQTWDNRQLVANLAYFLANEKRIKTIIDFPYLFNPDVAVLAEKDKTINQEMVGILNLLQSSFEAINTNLTITENPIAGQDLLIFAKYDQYPDLEKYLAPFHLKFENIEPANDESSSEGSSGDQDPQNSATAPSPTPTVPPLRKEETPPLPGETSATPIVEPPLENLYSLLENGSGGEEQNKGTVTVPGFGKLSTDGIGVVLYKHAPKGNTLILLANSKEGLLDLAGFFITGEFSNCTLQNNIAVCAITKDSVSDNGSSFNPFSSNGRNGYEE